MNRPLIPKKEFSERIRRIQSRMNKEAFDVLIAYGSCNEPQYIRYLSGFRTLFETAGIAIPKTGEASTLAGPESAERAQAYNTLGPVRRMNSFRESAAPKYMDNTFYSFNKLFSEYNGTIPLTKIGIVGWSFIPHEIYVDIETALHQISPKAQIVSADYIVDLERANKSPVEIACLKESGRITCAAMKYTIEHIREGMACDDIKGIALSSMFAEGAEGEGFPAWVTCNEDTQYAISVSSKKTIHRGDMIQIQIGASYEGYASAVGRAVILGEQNNEQRNLIESCISAKIATEKALACSYGKSAAFVAQAHKDEIIQQGNEMMLVYGPCHSVGLCECEAPWIELGASYKLTENMIFCVDIFLFDHEHHMGVRYEDMICIKKNGIERITDFPNDIIVIDSP